MTMAAFEERELAREFASKWWLFLVTGILWLWFSLIVFRLDLTTVYAISILFGVVAIFAGVNEFFSIPASSTGWKIAHGLLGVLFIVAGIVAFTRPGGTFVNLAAIMAWVLLFKGIFDVIASLMFRDVELWWMRLIAGVAEIALGFWASTGEFGEKAVTLVVIVGAIALTRGVTEIIVAFQLRGLKKQLAAD
jgi:uncharacterized membrane protein HdeD (DUF308 family)